MERQLTDKERTDSMIEDLSDATIMNVSGLISERVKLLFQGLYSKTRNIEKNLFELNQKTTQDNPEIKLHNDILNSHKEWIEYLREELESLKKEMKLISRTQIKKEDNLLETKKEEKKFEWD